MKTYYASLTGPFLGYFLPLPLKKETPRTEAQIIGGLLLNSDPKTQKVWCSIYTAEDVDEQIGKYRHGGFLEDACARRINYDDFTVRTHAAELGINLDDWLEV